MVYEGEFKANKMNGMGKMTYKNGKVYEGRFVNNKPETLEGETATMTFPNGDKYVGEFKAGKRTGQGTYTFADGKVYEGGFLDNKFTEGKLTGKDGSVKKVKFEDGKLVVVE